MVNLVKHTENNRTHYLIPLSKKYEENTAYLDLTDAVRSAIGRDKKFGYSPEYGPNYAQEILRANEYVEYVQEHANGDNLYKFNTPRRGYMFFLDVAGNKEAEKKNVRTKLPAKGRPAEAH